ncbi:OmpA family protein [Reichenbachiella agarivorans]|uniref:OmpA family protein n=1 Tax=Reichenbachiella agarivorans TaxID=2979464 RepID=A0ABY6CTG1_9BACT|nr:OmpA family protein [Reichenbachiella agarivorans]UXP33783.1 OmpA family protein [Reichenbachiella agarivorans]
MSKRFLVVIGLICALNSRAQIQVFSEQESIGYGLNTTSDESDVVISPDESQLYFTRKNHPDNVGGVQDPGDVWMSEHQVDGSWSAPINLKEINTAGLNQFIGFLDIERRILINTDNGLISYFRVSGKWFESDPIEVAYFKNQGEMFTASLSNDAKIMLFGMESFGTYGVEDIYVSKLQSDGKWSSPKNLGSKINTANQEITPFLASDNKTLFFSSNGLGGEGSFDVFMSTRLDDTWQNWSTPVNLGPKVNTVGRESSFVLPIEKEFAFLISTQNSDGYGDIKMVRVAQEIEKAEVVEEVVKVQKTEDKLAILTGEARDIVTKKVIVGAEVEAKVLPSGIVKKGRTNRMGQFTLHIPEGESYEIKVRAYLYMTAELDLNKTQAAQNQLHAFALNPIIEGNTISLDHVLFIQGKSELVAGSEKELDLVVEMMKYNPDINIFLSGHTDNQGNSDLNLKLSEDRVETVKKYLLKSGVAADRIAGQGFGGTKPRASNANEESRKLNRRVEFTIHKK